MLKLLKKYGLEKDAKGLLLISTPTGSGKTYHVLDFIYEHYKVFHEQRRRIFFVTNLKKNLPYNDLKKRFEKEGKIDEYNKHVLFIDSNADTVINHLLSIENEIQDSLKDSDFKKLTSYVKMLNNGKKIPKEVKETIKNDVQTKLEPAFRKSIYKHLHSVFKTKKERLEAIGNQSAYQWISKLYPAVFTGEKTVIFLSIDKFVRRNTPIVEKSYYFFEKLIDKAVTFIDEFDSTKENILRFIIDNGIRHKISLLDVFLNVHNHLMQIKIPRSLTRDSASRKEKMQTSRRKSISEFEKDFKEKTGRIFSDFNLKHTCKTHEEFSSNQRNFLFYDYQFHHVLDARHKRITISRDSKSRTNWIKAVGNKKTEEQHGEKNIRSLLRDIGGFFNYFQYGISIMADNYWQLKREVKTTEDSFTFQDAVSTALTHFRLDENIVNFITENIMERIFPYGYRKAREDVYREGFYETGFRYYDIVDSDVHDTFSKFYMYNFFQTPEFFLTCLCHSSLVVGLSATAGIETNIGNFDLNYLKSQLGEKFCQLTSDEIQRLNKQFLDLTRGYDQISLQVTFIGNDEGGKLLEDIEKLFNDREAANALKEKAKLPTEEPQNSDEKFFLERYYRILAAFDYFLGHKDIQAFLCLLNKSPKAGDEELDIEVLHEFSDLLVEKRNYSKCSRELIEVLTGDDFETRKENLLEKLANGNRCFVISTYQTIGAGQNLQYPVPSGFEPIQINNLRAHNEMDFNGIYLDRPTNLLVNIKNKDLEEIDFVKYLFQLEFLVENGAISPSVFKKKLDEAFHCFIGRQHFRRSIEDFKDLYQTDAYTRFVNKVLIQAVGRICRTNMKCPMVHILADSSLQKHLKNFFLPDVVIPVREYEALLKAAGERSKTQGIVKEFENRASNRSDRTAAFIHRQLRIPWKEESVSMWKEVRHQLLAHPYLIDSINNNKWLPLYVELPDPRNSYWFSQEYDYREVRVSFGKTDGLQEVGARSARLEELMQIPQLRELFETKGWATGFETARYIVTPPMFNNIYKGAIGEEIGRFVFEQLLDIGLQELETREFEIFDFKTPSGIYIDFKLWNDAYGVNAENQLKNIKEKIDKCAAKRVFIVNIIASPGTDFKPIISGEGRIVEIPFLCKGNGFDYEALSFIKKELYNEYYDEQINN